MHNKFDSVCSSSRAEAKKALGSRLFRPKDNYVIGNQNDIKGWNNIRKGNNGIITGDNNIILNEQWATKSDSIVNTFYVNSFTKKQNR